MFNLGIKELLTECWVELRDIADELEKIGKFDKKTLYLTRYALMRACGTFEVAFKALVADYAGPDLCSRTQSYIDISIRKSSSNPNLSNIRRLLKSFDKKWSQKFSEQIKLLKHQDRTEKSIEHLVELRNTFAHGNNALVSFDDVKRYFTEACRIIKIMDKIVSKP